MNREEPNPMQEPVCQTPRIRFSLRTFLLTHILIGAVATVVYALGFSPDIKKNAVFPYAVVGTMFVYWLFIIRLPWSYERNEGSCAQHVLDQSNPGKQPLREEINPSSTEALR